MHKKRTVSDRGRSRRIDRRLAISMRMQQSQAAQIHSAIQADARAER